MIVDTYGDLAALYALATWVVLGGTLVQIGLGLGQNLVEPLAHGVPVFFGPHIRRWATIADALTEIFPRLSIRTATDLADGIRALDGETAARLRTRALALTAEGRDAANRHVQALGSLLSGAKVSVA